MREPQAEISIARSIEAIDATWPQTKAPAVAPTMPLARNTAVPRARTQSGSDICAVMLSVLKVATQAPPPKNRAGAAIQALVACDSVTVAIACITAKVTSNW